MVGVTIFLVSFATIRRLIDRFSDTQRMTRSLKMRRDPTFNRTGHGRAHTPGRRYAAHSLRPGVRALPRCSG